MPADLPNLILRPFLLADQPAARALILAGLEEHWGSLDLTLNPDLNDIAASYAAGDFWVAELEGRLVATGALLPLDAQTGQITRMSVARDLRRGGLGQRMLTVLAQCARVRGLRRLMLETTSTWCEVIAFYQRCGFTITHTQHGDTYFERWLDAPNMT